MYDQMHKKIIHLLSSLTTLLTHWIAVGMAGLALGSGFGFMKVSEDAVCMTLNDVWYCQSK